MTSDRVRLVALIVTPRGYPHDMEVALVIAGGVLSLLGQWIAHDWNRKARVAELDEARLDRYSDSLRLALSEFCAASTNFINRGFLYAATELAIMNAEDEAAKELVKTGKAEEEANSEAHRHVNPDLKTRSRQSLEEFMAASSTSETKAVCVIGLLGHGPIREDVEQIGVRSWDMPTNMEQWRAFVRDLRVRRERLDALTKKLAGIFVPARIVDDEGEREDPPATRNRLLPPRLLS